MKLAYTIRTAVSCREKTLTSEPVCPRNETAVQIIENPNKLRLSRGSLLIIGFAFHETYKTLGVLPDTWRKRDTFGRRVYCTPEHVLVQTR